jgi:uncharacterized protein YbaA (DUF1428 family)
MRYVDGFVLPVPQKHLAAYRRMARTAGRVWRSHGALEYVESVADDVKPDKHTSLPQSVKLKADETVIFAYIVYKSRTQRDRVNAKAMKHPRLAKMMNPKAMPFDAKRMFWDGFKAMVELQRGSLKGSPPDWLRRLEKTLSKEPI